MSIIYKPRKMVCTIPGKERTGYFAGKVAGNKITTNILCKRISERCTLTGSDVKAVLEALVEEIELSLLYGDSIQMGDLGTFTATITSEVVDTIEALKPKKVKVKSIAFLPSVRIKKLMADIKFMRLKDFLKLMNGK